MWSCKYELLPKIHQTLKGWMSIPEKIVISMFKFFYDTLRNMSKITLDAREIIHHLQLCPTFERPFMYTCVSPNPIIYVLYLVYNLQGY